MKCEMQIAKSMQNLVWINVCEVHYRHKIGHPENII